MQLILLDELLKRAYEAGTGDPMSGMHPASQGRWPIEGLHISKDEAVRLLGQAPRYSSGKRHCFQSVFVASVRVGFSMGTRQPPLSI